MCAVKDRVPLLSEIFVKSNRLSLIWAVPFGVGLALFASDLVHFVLGAKWVPAIVILEIMGIVTAVHHVGYNWAAFVKARGTTWPIAISAVLVTAVTLAAAIPLMYSHGLVGLGIAFVIGEVVGFAIRGIWIARFFTGVRILTQLARAFAPAAIAALPVLLIRAAAGSDHSPGIAIAMFVLYVLTAIAATAVLERPLLREAAGYMIGERPQLA